MVCIVLSAECNCEHLKKQAERGHMTKQPKAVSWVELLELNQQRTFPCQKKSAKITKKIWDIFVITYMLETWESKQNCASYVNFDGLGGFWALLFNRTLLPWK